MPQGLRVPAPDAGGPDQRLIELADLGARRSSWSPARYRTRRSAGMLPCGSSRFETKSIVGVASVDAKKSIFE